MKTFLPTILTLLFSVSAYKIAYARQPAFQLQHEEVVEIVQNTASEFETRYLFPDKGEHVARLLRKKLAAGDFDQAFDFDRLKHSLEATVIRTTNDSNFELVKREALADTPDDADSQQVSVIDAQILDNNVGYLTLKGDFVFNESKQSITAAFRHITDVNALILDVRDVGLGNVELTQHLISFFTAPNTHLADIHFGHGNKRPLGSLEIQGFTFKNRELPVFILTSSFVSGPWELLVYTLKKLEKATIVGEDTMGLGIMTIPTTVSEHTSIFLSYAEIKLESTGDNWQTWGVVADYQTSADASFELAVKLAHEIDKPTTSE
ncbi:S41 family peptidase [Aestuariibacter salexigens]|uniref:S41 family peptidase n=1 Tax=Aestuariibacter salexigens TaxID=226010 RepID=UPI000414C540|nr:S41 family peptidase [Aestuariibacter salexigens]